VQVRNGNPAVEIYDIEPLFARGDLLKAKIPEKQALD
jgi:hypothetical protein